MDLFVKPWTGDEFREFVLISRKKKLHSCVCCNNNNNNNKLNLSLSECDFNRWILLANPKGGKGKGKVGPLVMGPPTSDPEGVEADRDSHHQFFDALSLRETNTRGWRGI